MSKRSSVLAVLGGWAVDFLGTMGFGFFFGLMLMIGLQMRGANPMQALEVAKTPPFLGFALFAGMTFTVLGGYVAAVLAGRREVWHGLGVGILSELVGLVEVLRETEPGMGWFMVAGLALTIPAGVFGGYLRVLQRR